MSQRALQGIDKESHVELLVDVKNDSEASKTMFLKPSEACITPSASSASNPLFLAHTQGQQSTSATNNPGSVLFHQ